MFDTRGMLWLFALGAVGTLPACLTVSKKLPPKDPNPLAATTVEATPVPTGPTNFAELPPLKMRPGDRILKNPDAKTALPDPPSIPPPPGSFLQTVSQTGSKPIIPLPMVEVTIDPPLVAALRAFLAGDPPRAVEALKALDKPNQEIVLNLLPLLVRGAQMNFSQLSPQDIAVMADQLHAEAERFEPQAALRVDKLTFCRRVDGFGRYEPWPEGQPFQANDLAELYLEIRHLRCEAATGKASGGGYVTRLVSSLEIRNSKGQVMEQTDPNDWQQLVPRARYEHTDFSHTPVRDYFMKYRFQVPAVHGTYTVMVEVRDITSGRVSRSQPLQFRVGP